VMRKFHKFHPISVLWMANSGAQFALDDEAWPGGAWGHGRRTERIDGPNVHEGPNFRRLGCRIDRATTIAME